MPTSSTIFVILIIVQTSYVSSEVHQSLLNDDNYRQAVLLLQDPDSNSSNITDYSTAKSTDLTTLPTGTVTNAHVTVQSTMAPFTETDAFDTEITTDFITTSNDRNSTISSPPESETNLPLILGLTLGLGIPACLATVVGLVYYFKVYVPRKSHIGTP